MPETDFLLGPEDQAALIRLLLETGATFVPALAYDIASYRTLSTLDAIEKVVESGELGGPFFVLPGGVALHSLEIHPVQMQTIEWEGQTRFFLTQRHGGPYLDLLPSSTRLRPEGLLLCSGFVAHYRDYITVDQENVPVSQSVKDLYRSAVSFLRRSCTRCVTEGARRVYWIGPAAKEAIASGMATNVPGLQVREYKSGKSGDTNRL